ncbi:MAG: hypothetical protein R3F02_02750 [Thiolinea sp.]
MMKNKYQAFWVTTTLAAGLLALTWNISQADNPTGLVKRINTLETNHQTLAQRVTELETHHKLLQGALSQSILISPTACSKLPGNWKETSVGKGRFLLGQGNGYSPGRRGGQATVRLDRKHIPRHVHQLPVDSVPTGRSQQSLRESDNSDEGIHSRRSIYTGEGNLPATPQPHENMPPYIVVYFCQLNSG